jgi:hypothetical protein
MDDCTYENDKEATEERKDSLKRFFSQQSFLLVASHPAV